MFGVYMFVLFVIFKFIKAMEPMNKEMHNYKKAIKNNDDYFINRHGYRTTTKNGLSYNYKHLLDNDKVGDYVKYNPYNGRIIKNISNKLREDFEKKSKEKAVEMGLLLYPFESNNNSPHENDIKLFQSKYYNRHYNDDIVGCRYKDVNTNKIYVFRKYHDIRFLIDVNERKIAGLLNNDMQENEKIIINMLEDMMSMQKYKFFNDYNIDIDLSDGPGFYYDWLNWRKYE